MEPTYAAIARLVYTYAERLDAGDLTGMASLFEHATFRTGGGAATLTGSAEVLAAFTASVRLVADGTPGTRHVTTNLIVDEGPDGTTASARSYFTVLQATPTLPLQIVAAGAYRDEFVRDEVVRDGWRFADRMVRIDLVGDVSEHLFVDLGNDVASPAGN
jgi:3-phenylpropionate/cinnamic acid dioxygenase small subunit